MLRTIKPLLVAVLLIVILTVACTSVPPTEAVQSMPAARSGEVTGSGEEALPPKTIAAFNVSHRADRIAPPITRKENATVIVELETKDVVAELAPGVTYQYWTFNGTVPGPFIRVKEGDTVVIRLSHPDGGGEADTQDAHEHAGHEAHSIDLHAVIGPGGGATVMQVEPGETREFQFKASRPGLYVYHCASKHIPTHIAKGMFGMILVEPKAGLPPVDREFYIVQSEFYTRSEVGEEGYQEFSRAKLKEERPEYFVFNGQVGAFMGENALKVKVGETVRIFFGVGTFMPSSLHLIGGIFDRVYAEGDIVSPPRRNVQTTLVSAGGAVMVEFTLDVPGNYLLVDHTLVRAIDRGAIAEIIVEGPEQPEIFRKIE